MGTGSHCRTAFAVGATLALLFSAGCVVFVFGDDTDAGELTVLNRDDRAHDVVVQTGQQGNTSLTVPANGSRRISLFESPGTYSVNATVDGEAIANTTIEYVPGGPNGDSVAGPGLILGIEPAGEPYFSRTYD